MNIALHFLSRSRWFWAPWNCASIQLSHLFALELALALSVKRYTFPNNYTRSLKVNTAVELLVQETFQLCSAKHSSVTLLLLLSENWSSQLLNTKTIPDWFWESCSALSRSLWLDRFPKMSPYQSIPITGWLGGVIFGWVATFELQLSRPL